MHDPAPSSGFGDPARLKVFLSFSGQRGAALARELERWLPGVLPGLDPWLSHRIEKGQSWWQELSANLSDSHAGILCVSPENCDAPWLMFEAGALWRASGRRCVYPLLLGMGAEEFERLESPLNEFQATEFDEESVLDLLRSLDLLRRHDRQGDPGLAARFAASWPEFSRRVDAISRLAVSADPASVRKIVRAISDGARLARVGSAHAQFDGGFESHKLYAIMLSVANRRLYVFGRKNRKMFDKDHAEELARLAARIREGLDFRVLFLDPSAPDDILHRAHAESDFPDKLRRAIDEATSALRRAGIAPEGHCRVYSAHRSTTVSVIDDAVLYCPIVNDHRGVAKGLTDAPFSVVSADTKLGSALVAEFDGYWANARPLASSAAS